MASELPAVGTRGFTSRAEVERYIQAFNRDQFDIYTQYYRHDIFMDIGSIPGPKTLDGYLNWVKDHHQIATETLVPKKIILDQEGKFVVIESWTEFKGCKGVNIENFFGWGPLAEGSGPVVKMIVFYHLDPKGRATHLEAVSVLLSKATT